MNGYDALTKESGLVDFCDRTQIEFSGEDRSAFLHNLCTNDINNLNSGDGCEVFITTVRGKVLAHGIVFCTPTSLILETAAGQGDLLMAHFDRYLINEDVQLYDRSSEWCEYLLSGPQAEQVLAELYVAEIPATQGAHQAVQVDRVDGWIRRVPWLSASTFLIGTARLDAETLWGCLLKAGAHECDLDSFHVVRLETGYPWFPVDIGEANLPQEVARDEEAISFQKGCYLGQETVARLDALGHVNQILTLIQLAGSVVPSEGTEIVSDGQAVGRVTSATFSPRLQAPIALTVLRCSALRQALNVGEITASVVALPVN